jgi:inosine/xanthosine triphosphatase
MSNKPAISERRLDDRIQFHGSGKGARNVKIVVASLNPVKLGAVEKAFRSQFPGTEPGLVPVSVDSGVAEQPMSDAETLQGARNRVAAARSLVSEADFWVGLEGGLDVFDGRMMGFAWMAIGDGTGRISEARSATLPLPPAVCELLDAGLELGAANDRVFSTVNSKQEGGAFGLLSNGLYTRESIYTQTLVLALIPFVHELWAAPRS